MSDRDDNKDVLLTRRAWISFPFSWLALGLFLFMTPYLFSGSRVVLDFLGVPTGYALIAVLPALLIFVQIPVRRLLVSYAVREGRAVINRFPGVPESMPLLDSTLKRKGRLKALLNYGTIEIASSNGLSIQQWVNIADVDKVYEKLLCASKGMVLEPAKTTELWERLPLGLIEFLIDINLLDLGDSDEYILRYWSWRAQFKRSKPLNRKIEFLKGHITAATCEHSPTKLMDMQIIRALFEMCDPAGGFKEFLDQQKAGEEERKTFWSVFVECNQKLKLYRLAGS
jgi:hypothetical protein